MSPYEEGKQHGRELRRTESAWGILCYQYAAWKSQKEAPTRTDRALSLGVLRGLRDHTIPVYPR